MNLTQKLIERYRGGPNHALNRTLMLLAAASAYFSFSCFSNMNGSGPPSFETVAAASVIAFATGIAIYTAWHVLLASVLEDDRIKDNRKKVIALILTVIVIFGISTWPNVAGIAGDQALDLNIDRSLQEYEAVVHDYYIYNQALQGIEPIIAQEIAGLSRRESNERLHGTETGSPGTGDAQRALANLAAELSLIQTTLQTQQKKQSNILAKVQQSLGLARQVSQANDARHLRINLMKQHTDQIAALLAELDNRIFLTSLVKHLSQLPVKTIATHNPAKSQSLRLRQQQVITTLQESANTTIENITDEIDLVIAQAPPPIPQFERISAMKAVVRYATEFGPAWVVGFGIDAMPLLVIALIMISKGSMTTSERRWQSVSSATVEDLMRAKAADEFIKRMSIKPDHKDDFFQTFFGDKRVGEPEHDETE